MSNFQDTNNGKSKVRIFTSKDTNQLEQDVNDFIMYCGKCRYKIFSIEMQTVIQDGNELICCLVHYSCEVDTNMNTDVRLSEQQLYDSLRLEQNAQKTRNRTRYGDSNCTWDKLW